jgi:hypothetical protein
MANTPRPARPLDFRNVKEGSHAANRKLVILVLTLIGVIYAMIELGKPQRWYWLIPPEDRDAKSRQIELLDQDRELEAQNRDSVGESASPNSEPTQPDSVEPATPPNLAANLILPDQPKLAQLNSDEYPAAAQRFWAERVRRMSAQQRRSLNLLLKRVRHHQEIEEEFRPELEGLLAALRKARANFHEDLMNQATYAAEGAEQARLVNDHFEAESRWDRAEWPAISSFLAGQRLSAEQLLALRQLQAALDPLMLEFVEDRTAQGWDGDSPAWSRMWERLLCEELPNPTAVTHLELSAQPETYRDRPVLIRGWVRGAWREALPIPELGIKYLYVLVVRPEDSKVTPYFLYARALPAGFPEIQQKYVALDQRIECQGLFFKIRTYLDTEKKVQTGPMILVDSIKMVAVSSAISQKLAGPLSQPSWWIIGLGVLSLMAAGVTWFVYRTTQTIRFQTGPNRTREIHQSLGGLVDDTGIKTDIEKVRELYD